MLSKLLYPLNALLSFVKWAWTFFTQNEAPRAVLMTAVTIGLFVGLCKECSRANEAERTANAKGKEVTALTNTNRELVSQRDKATAKADSILQTLQTLSQHAKDTVATIPANKRSAVVRGKLAELGLTR